MVSAYFAVWVPDAAVPLMLIVTVPVAADLLTAIVMVAPPPVVIEVGLIVTVTPAGAPLAVSATDWLSPDTTELCSEIVVEAPRLTVPDFGVSPMWKSVVGGGVSDEVNFHWLAEP